MGGRGIMKCFCFEHLTLYVGPGWTWLKFGKLMWRARECVSVHTLDRLPHELTEHVSEQAARVWYSWMILRLWLKIFAVAESAFLEPAKGRGSKKCWEFKNCDKKLWTVRYRTLNRATQQLARNLSIHQTANNAGYNKITANCNSATLQHSCLVNWTHIV